MTELEIVKDYIGIVGRLDQSEINPNLNKRMCHAISGMTDEAGELFTMLYPHMYYNRDLDFTNIKEELGDLWWYFNLALQELASLDGSIPQEVFAEVIAMNKAKLSKRYSEGGYSDKQANVRDLQAERKVLEDAEEKKKT